MTFDSSNFPDLPISWANSSVEDTSEIVSFMNKVPTSKYKSTGKLAIIDQSISFIGGYIDDPELAVTKNIPVIVFGDHTRVIKFIDFPFAAGADGIKVLKPKEYFNPKLYYYFLQAIKLPNKGYARHFQYLRSSIIPIPPLNEQKRIADKLDTLLARVDACREHLDRVPGILKRFRQAVLAAAVSGRLTEEWRAKQSFAEWEQVRLEEVCISISDGNHQAPPKQQEGVPFITISDISDGHLDLSHATRFVSQDYYDKLQLERKAEKDDVLYSVTGSIGIPVLVDINVPFIFQRHLGILKPDKSKLLSRYLVIVLGTDDVKRQAFKVATGTAQLTIPLGGLRNIMIPLPTMNEQWEIIHRVETLFSFLDHLENRYKAAHSLIENLTPALLAKAFCGELVPQDPNDEPTSILLERIRAKREARAKGTRLHRQPTRKKTGLKVEGVMQKLTEIKPTHLSDILKVNGSMLAERLWAASELEIEDFYDQLKDEELKGLLREIRNPLNDLVRMLEAV